MACYQPNAEFLVKFLATLIIIPSVFCQHLWNSTAAPKASKKYDAIVKRYITQINNYYVCQGVILNDRYVLTARNCTQDGPSIARDVSVIVGYTHVGQIEGNRKNFEGNAGVYNASAIYAIVSLALIRTQNSIKLDDQVTCINLPNRRYAEMWKNPFGLPNQMRYDSSYWCREQKSKDYQLFLKCGTRNCSYNVIYGTASWYIPTCLKEKASPNICKWVRGAPLVYNGTLVGIRNYNGEKAPAPYNKSHGEIFINIARHTNEINEIMYEYTPCIR